MPISMSFSLDEQLERADELISIGNLDEALEVLTKLYDEGEDKRVLYKIASVLNKQNFNVYSYYIYERIHTLLDCDDPEQRALLRTIVSTFKDAPFYPIGGYMSRLIGGSEAPSPEDSPIEPSFTVAGEQGDEDLEEDEDIEWEEFSVEKVLSEFLDYKLQYQTESESFVTAEEAKTVKNNRAFIRAERFVIKHQYVLAYRELIDNYEFGLSEEEDVTISLLLSDLTKKMNKKEESISWLEKAIEYGIFDSAIYIKMIHSKEYRAEAISRREEVEILDPAEGVEIAKLLYRYKEYDTCLYFVEKTAELFPESCLDPLSIPVARYNCGLPNAKEELLDFIRKYRAVLPYDIIKDCNLPEKIDLGSALFPDKLYNRLKKGIVKILSSKEHVEFTPTLKRCIFFYFMNRVDFGRERCIFDGFDRDSVYNDDIITCYLEAICSVKTHQDMKCKYIYDILLRGYKGPIKIINGAYTHTAVNYIPDGYDSFPEVILRGIAYALGLIISDETYFNFYDINDIAKKVVDYYKKKGKLPRAITEFYDLGRAIVIYKFDSQFDSLSSSHEYYSYKLDLSIERSVKLRMAINKVMSEEE